MTRRKRIPKSARRVTILLTPAEELALQVIEARRRHRSEGRDSPSEVVSDALWKFLQETEGVPRDQIEALLPADAGSALQSNLRGFPNK
jgi:hypothetical protein